MPHDKESQSVECGVEYDSELDDDDDVKKESKEKGENHTLRHAAAPRHYHMTMACNIINFGYIMLHDYANSQPAACI